MATVELAEVFAPGEFIQEELEARGWTQSELAEIMGRDTALVSAIISGKRAITPETARDLGEAFGTGGQFWLNLEAAYRYSRIDPTDTVSRRAKLYSQAPIQQMVRRGWISEDAPKDIAKLEKQYKRFFGVSSVDEELALLAHAARKSSNYNSVTIEERAWLYRARNMAKLLACNSFSTSALNSALCEVKALLLSPEEIRKLPGILQKAGIRLLILENLTKTKIDGACFWLNNASPVIALSLRFDRIDWFWHTVLHELRHVFKREGRARAIVDTALDQSGSADERPEQEINADRKAAAFMVPPDQLMDFIVRVKPFYSKTKIKGFAQRLGVHPGIVVGQLQYRGEISYAHNREMLAPIKDIITSTALTDGWGDVAPADGEK